MNADKTSGFHRRCYEKFSVLMLSRLSTALTVIASPVFELLEPTRMVPDQPLDFACREFCLRLVHVGLACGKGFV